MIALAQEVRKYANSDTSVDVDKTWTQNDADELSKTLYHGLNLHSQLSDRKATTFEGALDIAQAYFQWVGVGHRFAGLVEEMEAMNLNVEARERFMSTLRQVTFCLDDARRIILSSQAAIAGEGKPLNEFIESL